MARAQQQLPARTAFSRAMAPLAVIAITVATFGFMQRLGQWEGQLAVLAQYLWTHGAFDPFTLRHPNDWRWPQTVTMFVSHGVLHVSLLHLVSNMVPLAVLGWIAAQRLGGARFIALYLGCMVAAAFVYGVWQGGLGTMVGASGAVHGILGAVIAWSVVDRRWAWAAFWAAAALAMNAWFWHLTDGAFAWRLHIAGAAIGACVAPFLARKKAAP